MDRGGWVLGTPYGFLVHVPLSSSMEFFVWSRIPVRTLMAAILTAPAKPAHYDTELPF
jgi:hypothetical protein